MSDPEATVWIAFFNRTFELTESYLEQGLIPPADVASCESYLYTGLTASTVLVCVKQSMGLPGQELMLSSGYVLRPQDVTSPMLRGLLGAMPAAKEKLRQVLGGSEAEWTHLQRWVVTAEMEVRPEMPTAYPPDRVVLHNQMCSAVYSLATPLTQMPTFRAHFQRILDVLSMHQGKLSTQGFGMGDPLATHVATRVRATAEDLMARGVLTRAMLMHPMEETILTLTTCLVLTYDADDEPRTAGVRRCLGRRPLAEVLSIAVRGGDESDDAVNAAREVCFELYPVVEKAVGDVVVALRKTK